MLATVVVDTYAAGEAKALREALKDLFDGAGWSATGAYCYFDLETREILYLGLASKLATRFAQHNGLTAQKKGNKLEHINSYFASGRRLGFSVYAQASAVEILAHLESAREIVASAEGQLLESHRQTYGRIPIWNRVGGSVFGARHTSAHTPGHFASLTVWVDSLFVARLPIRQLAADFRSYSREQVLHAARLNAVMEGGLSREPIDERDVVRWLRKLAREPLWRANSSDIEDLIKNGYLRLPPPIPPMVTNPHRQPMLENLTI